MSEMTTITFDVPTVVLREADFVLSANGYRVDAQNAAGKTARERVNSLAYAALLEAKEVLPPPRIPVSVGTEWGQKITNGVDVAWYVARDPQRGIDFLYVGDGIIGSAPYASSEWFEVHEDDEPEPEPERVPVEAGKKRRDPKTGEVFTPLELYEGKPHRRTWRIEDGDGYTMRVPESLLDGWEIVE